MRCESCKTANFDIELPNDEGPQPIWLCWACHERLFNYALRPREFFNLAAKHGQLALWHDDIYDEESGEALQPLTAVENPELFPFPQIEEARGNPVLLLDFAFVQFWLSSQVLTMLKELDQANLLSNLEEKVDGNWALRNRAFEIAAKVLGRFAEDWIKNQWSKRQPGELLLFAEALACCLPFEEAFDLIVQEKFDNDEGPELPQKAQALLHFPSERALDWIEEVRGGIGNVTSVWGQLAASSQFSWARASKWLAYGRPLSLIALDALAICTMLDGNKDQSWWPDGQTPKLIDSFLAEEVEKCLAELLNKDNVPRTKNTVARILENLGSIY